MKINEVENLLDISKANIRFYEKEGLLSPSRTAAGYREYSQEDIKRLQTVLLLRKLGFPVKVIRQILDGTLPLDKALAENIAALEAEQARLKGALALCRQMQKEQPQTLDVQRYWDAVQRQESGGDTFQSIAGDYRILYNRHGISISSTFRIPPSGGLTAISVCAFLLCPCFTQSSEVLEQEAISFPSFFTVWQANCWASPCGAFFCTFPTASSKRTPKRDSTCAPL